MSNDDNSKNIEPKQVQQSVNEQLEKLFELKQNGIITEDEFEQQKSILLKNN